MISVMVGAGMISVMVGAGMISVMVRLDQPPAAPVPLEGAA
jgi:hypothetical protein